MHTAIAESYGLSPLQQGMLFHHLTERQPGVDVEQIVCTLREDVRVDAFRDAWERFAARHAACRTAFRWDGGDMRQDVYASVHVPVEVVDWRDRDTGAREPDFNAFLAADRERGFDLERAPVMRVSLVRVDQRESRCVWTFHHLLMDGRSFPVALGEVFALYEAIRDGRELLLTTPGEYRELIEWLSRRDTSADEPFWRELLRGFTAPTPLAFASSSDPAGRDERDASLSVETTLALRTIADRHGLTLNTIVQGAWAILLARHAGDTDVVFGATRAGRYGTVPRADSTLGVFINTLPVRVRLDESRNVLDWLADLREQSVAVRAHEHAALVDVMRWSDVPHGSPLFESIIVYDHELLGTTMRSRGGAWSQRDARLVERTSFPITLYAYGEDALALKLAYDRPRFCHRAMARVLDRLVTILEGIAADPRCALRDVPLMPASERETVLRDWNATTVAYDRARCVHELFADQVARTPDAMAVAYQDESLTYRELDQRSTLLANHLRTLGVGPEVRVGICLERSLEMMIAILGTLKAGGAYVPLDPAYPAGRVEYMLRDAGITVLLTQVSLRAGLPQVDAVVIALDAEWESIAAGASETTGPAATPGNLAYVLYTSGSTGRPKGVMVEHRNVVNFFAGMDARLGTEPGVWLAVTSLSFDISVLELLWTLTRGFGVVIHRDEVREQARPTLRSVSRNGRHSMQFSLFYFAADEGDGGSNKYRLLLEGARFADTHGFVAVWTPERHFHAFGGLYPNPSVTAAALSTITQRVSIRSGSVVLPLHHPARVAEEWAVVDNLSHGRVGISFASGWQPNDFVLRPESFSDAKGILMRNLDVVRRLWRGETISFAGPNGREVPVRTLPRPIQQELPVWVTTSGSADTYKAAAQAGANILTHLLGQSVDDVKAKVAMYREAWREAGHAGEGHVSLMLHTFVGEDDDEVKELVRRPLTEYLRTSVGLIKGFADTFPAFKRSGAAVTSDMLQSLSAEEMDALLAWSFERYYETSGLFGTPERCLAMVDTLRHAGIDEIACLIDFGVDADTVLAHLEHLNAVRLRASEPSFAETRSYSVPALIRRCGVTHLQCTPSMASMLLASDDAREALGALRVVMIGGEAFPAALASSLKRLVRGRLINMYGPTETTIWSTTYQLDGVTANTVPIGTPIANTQLYILDTVGRVVPPGVAGELFIAGDGVVRGYHERTDLTAERFVPDPFSSQRGARMYRTGDRARWRDDGVVEFLGRIDHQVKVRGHRIELGEIEAVLAEHRDVRDAVAIVREDVPGDVRIVAYVTPANGSISTDALREYLRDQLPEIMVPSHVVALEAMPLTPNAKVDRKALPAPEMSVSAAAAAAAFVSPATALEESIAAIWREALSIARVGVDDNFFDLGGHSLLAIRVHGRLRTALGRDLSITDLFRYPTVRTLASYLARDVEADADASGSGADRGEARRSALLRRRQARRGRPAEVNAMPVEEQS
ncbi:MAG: MupA/Atu3671 family FMN-dependent luciferase-like monooxygenase [Gemmatimonadaceae bacterium]